MARSRDVKKTMMSMYGDNATIGSPYHLRHSGRKSAKLTDSITLKPNVYDKPSTIIISSGEKCKYCTYCLAGIFVISVCIMLICMLFPYPLRASCIVKWKFSYPCINIIQKFRYELINLSSWNACRQHTDNCLYTLKISTEDNIIRATHVASNLRSLENIEMVFEQVNNTCLAVAESVSNKWFVIFDYGANYCNLHNLVVATGLNGHAIFLEMTNDAVCTQFNMAFCK